MLQRNLDRAATLLNNGRPNVAGLLAQAAVAFELGDHAAALASYRKALKEFPGCPPEVLSRTLRLTSSASRCRIADACSLKGVIFRPLGKHDIQADLRH